MDTFSAFHVSTGPTLIAFGREVDGVEEMRRAVREEVKRGAGAIKVVATGGVLTPGISYGRTAFSADELGAAADETHNAGLRLAAHAIGNQGIKRALAAGVDTVEHGVQLDSEAIDLFQGGAWLVPTLAPIEHILRHGRPAGIQPVTLQTNGQFVVESFQPLSYEPLTGSSTSRERTPAPTRAQ